MPGPGAGPSRWSISQIRDVEDSEHIDSSSFTCIEFNQTGEYLALGDRGGRITILRAIDENVDGYAIYCAFISHDPEFDYLKSTAINEKINAIAWLPPSSATRSLLSANDQTIRHWRIDERRTEAYNFNIREVDGLRFPGEEAQHKQGANLLASLACIKSVDDLRIPRFRSVPRMSVEVRMHQEFTNGHSFHINGVSLNSDQETFISCDEVRINLWNFGYPDKPFGLLNLKPSDLENLNEVITTARFHNSHCNQLAYSTSKGTVRLCDLRLRSTCEQQVLTFEDPDKYGYMGFFRNLMLNLTDFQFSNGGQYILARDYLTLKVWDFRMSDVPCEMYEVHDPLRGQMCTLYENDALFDRFMCSWSSDDRYLTTGSYSNTIRIVDRHTGKDCLLDLTDAEDYVYAAPRIGSTNSLWFETPIDLTPKRLISPSETLGERLGLPAICVASNETAAMLEKAVGIDSSSDESSLSSTGVSIESVIPEPSGSPVAPAMLLDSEEFEDPVDEFSSSSSSKRQKLSPPRLGDEVKAGNYLTDIFEPLTIEVPRSPPDQMLAALLAKKVEDPLDELLRMPSTSTQKQEDEPQAGSSFDHPLARSQVVASGDSASDPMLDPMYEFEQSTLEHRKLSPWFEGDEPNLFSTESSAELYDQDVHDALGEPVVVLEPLDEPLFEISSSPEPKEQELTKDSEAHQSTCPGLPPIDPPETSAAKAKEDNKTSSNESMKPSTSKSREESPSSARATRRTPRKQRLTTRQIHPMPSGSHGADNTDRPRASGSGQTMLEPQVRMVAGRFFHNDKPLADMHELDSQQRVLQVVWHPKSMRMAAMADNRLYVIRDTPTQTPTAASTNNATTHASPPQPGPSQPRSTERPPAEHEASTSSNRTVIAGPGQRRRLATELSPSTRRLLAVRLARSRRAKAFKSPKSSPKKPP